MGITKCDNMLMVLAVAREMTPDEREKVYSYRFHSIDVYSVEEKHN